MHYSWLYLGSGGTRYRFGPPPFLASAA
ncbi:hypothetical protein MILUP08_40693 [Micromonospora lupini str. Lupac 08]|uniref:Uncharacterized protein n=1 Tax=Micromonospora lupini str. Lupac 08 TaxID=1150864 RepID=I0KW35_9ACTN|nr:hypothetical protein MILUP08_40693 [Micromonospora lupini str. Lupac 08]